MHSSSPDYLKEGDSFILYHPEGNFLLFYSPGKKFHTHLGEVVFSEKISYGDPVVSSKGETFYILHPNMVDLSMKVKRKTTIIYPKEAGLILLELGVRCGAVVGEVGTGSGALTFILASVVGKEGKVYTFERRKEFLENARENLKRYGDFPWVEWVERDVEVEGFGITGLDALFLDVPEPWRLVSHAFEALKGGRTLGSLSPNLEQVKLTHEAMKKEGFTRLRVYEVLQREIMIRPEGTRPRERGILHTGYLLFGEKTNKKEPL
ncbi:hypothetical protein DRQ16_02070 [bacterium]|nr:MAG: hypothetical protein DRQ16_02070 [bacterium]